MRDILLFFTQLTQHKLHQCDTNKHRSMKQKVIILFHSFPGLPSYFIYFYHRLKKFVQLFNVEIIFTRKYFGYKELMIILSVQS